VLFSVGTPFILEGSVPCGQGPGSCLQQKIDSEECDGYTRSWPSFRRVTHDPVTPLPDRAHVCRLCLAHCNLTASDVGLLCHFTGLKELELTGCNLGVQHAQKLVDVVLPACR
jgi:hypothetical protein